MKYQQLTLFDMKPVARVRCSVCRTVTRFPGMSRDHLPGCTYDCKCGRVMRINSDYTTDDLYVTMSESLREHYGVVTQPSDWASLEVGDV